MQRYLFIAALCISAIAYFLNQFLSEPPEVIPASAAESEFSAERAMTLLRHLLQEGVPHPVGSEANKRVKERILGWLAREGIEAEAGESWGCSARWSNCAWVENIVATIPGEQQSPYVALMAHYDSVPPAPGAGDDGAGLATVLEVGRMLKQEGPFVNPVLLIITDAEENGLLGAEAFFSHHPLKDRIGVVINVEGSGTTGQSQLIRTAMSNKSLIDAYGEGAGYPAGASLINEIFKRMPNDTDFSVSRRAEIPGIDFAFAAERTHYHTVNDNLENLDLRTLQHHGENVLPLVRILADTDLTNLDDATLLYSNLYGQWISWPTELSLYLVLTAIVLLLIVSIRVRPPYLKLGMAIVSPLLIIFICSLVLFLNFKLLEMINGTTVPWPANDLPFRIVLFCTPAVVGFSLASILNRYLSEEESLLGLWWFWTVLALACVLLLPDAANLLIMPLLVASMLLAIASMLPKNVRTARRVIQLLTLVLVVPVSLGMVLLLEISQGYRLIAATFFSLGIFFASIAPFVRGTLVKPVIVLGLSLSIGGSVGAVTIPLYSAFRPQHLNFQFIQDLDENTAYWRAQSQNPLPDKLTNEMEFTDEAFVFPWSESKTKNLAVAETQDIAAPQLVVRDVRHDEQGQSVEVDIAVSAQGRASQVYFVFPEASVLKRFTVEQDTFEAKPVPWGSARGNYVVMFSGVQNRQIELTLKFEGVGPHAGYIVQAWNHLPGSAVNLLQARAPHAVPVHRGDQTISFQKISL
jgi:Peptidase family M28